MAQTVWALLDAASKNGLKGIHVPKERQPPPPPPPQVATSNPAPGGACSSLSAESSSKGGVVCRFAEKDKGRRGGRGAVGGGRRGRQGSEGEHDAMMTEMRGGGRSSAPGAAPAVAAESNDDAAMEVCGDGSTADGSSSSSDEPNGGGGGGGDGQQLVPPEGRCGYTRGDEAGPAADARTPGGGVVDDCSVVSATGASSGGCGGGSSPDCGEKLTATAVATAAVSRADGDNGSLEQGAVKPSTGLCPRVAVATRSGGKRKPSALSAAGVAERKQLVAPPPPPPPMFTLPVMADGSSVMPPKPKMNQVGRSRTARCSPNSHVTCYSYLILVPMTRRACLAASRLLFLATRESRYKNNVLNSIAFVALGIEHPEESAGSWSGHHTGCGDTAGGCSG